MSESNLNFKVDSKAVMQAHGLADLEDFMNAISIAASTHAYAEWKSADRKKLVARNSKTGRFKPAPVVTNRQILEWQAEGGRNIMANDEDAKAATDAYATEVLSQIDRNTRNEVFNTANSAAIAAGKKKARKLREMSDLTKAGIVGGLRKGILLIADRMSQRFQKQIDNSGVRLGKVEERYAKWRKAAHGVSEDSVLIATKQLGDALLARHFAIHMDKKPGISTLRMHSFAAKRRSTVKSQIKQKAKLKAQKAKARSARKPRKK